MKTLKQAGKEFLLMDDDGAKAKYGQSVAAYITTLLWTDGGDMDEVGDGWGDEVTFSTELLDEIVVEVSEWYRRLRAVVGAEAVIALELPSVKRGDGAMMHDLWLTRNGHGAGFWDGDWPQVYEDRLTALAGGMGEHHIYKGDDGLLYGDVSGQTAAFCKGCGSSAKDGVRVCEGCGGEVTV